MVFEDELARRTEFKKKRRERTETAKTVHWGGRTKYKNLM